MTGMGSHQSAAMETDVWLTPPEMINALGPFDLDPCSPIDRPWDTAAEHYTVREDGLIQDWRGLVWMNPPYGRMTEAWMNRLVLHGNGIALIFARTETRMFFDYVWSCADAMLFIKGRLYFRQPDGSKAKWTGGAPSVLIAYGPTAVKRLEDSGIPGALIRLPGGTS